MTDGTFETVARSERSFYGPRKLLLCGFPPEAQSKFKILLDMVGVEDLPLIWCSNEDAAETVGGLLLRTDGSGQGIQSKPVCLPTDTSFTIYFSR